MDSVLLSLDSGIIDLPSGCREDVLVPLVPPPLHHFGCMTLLRKLVCG